MESFTACIPFNRCPLTCPWTPSLPNYFKLSPRFLGVSSIEIVFHLFLLCKLQLSGSVVSVSPVLCAEQEEYLSRKYVLIILGSPGVTQWPQQSYLGSVSIFAARRPLPSQLSARSLAIMNSLYLPNFISQKEIFSSLTEHNTQLLMSIVP